MAPAAQGEGAESGRVRLTLVLSCDLNARLEQLSEDTGGSKSEVLRRSIALYEVAHEAKHEGRHMAVLDAGDRVLTRIVGI